MITPHAILRDRLLVRAGLFEQPKAKHTFAALEASEWSSQFERLMRNRLIMGALRYGKLGAPGKPQYDRFKSMFKRLLAYHDTGNLELLVDIANLCLVEFVDGNHPRRHWHAADGGHHVEVQS